jgi:hypothetical protein
MAPSFAVIPSKARVVFTGAGAFSAFNNMADASQPSVGSLVISTNALFSGILNSDNLSGSIASVHNWASDEAGEQRSIGAFAYESGFIKVTSGTTFYAGSMAAGVATTNSTAYFGVDTTWVD